LQYGYIMLLILKKYVFDSSDACFYIGIPFLISAQSLFLMYDCLLGTKEPQDGAAAHTVNRNDVNHNNNNASHTNPNDVRVPVH